MEHQVQNLQLEEDYLNVLNVINGKIGSAKWTIYNIIRDCLDLFKCFNKWECCYIPREINEVAHLSADAAKSSENSIFWNEDLPLLLSSLTSEKLDISH